MRERRKECEGQRGLRDTKWVHALTKVYETHLQTNVYVGCWLGGGLRRAALQFLSAVMLRAYNMLIKTDCTDIQTSWNPIILTRTKNRISDVSPFHWKYSISSFWIWWQQYILKTNGKGDHNRLEKWLAQIKKKLEEYFTTDWDNCRSVTWLHIKVGFQRSRASQRFTNLQQSCV